MNVSLSGVQALRPAAGPLNLILQGREVGTCSNATEVAFAGAVGDVPDDLEYAEIARALDVDVGTVKSRLSRARVALRSALSEVCDD